MREVNEGIAILFHQPPPLRVRLAVDRLLERRKQVSRPAIDAVLQRFTSRITHHVQPARTVGPPAAAATSRSRVYRREPAERKAHPSATGDEEIFGRNPAQIA
jgi:hypothetical protein